MVAQKGRKKQEHLTSDMEAQKGMHVNTHMTYSSGHKPEHGL